MTFENLTNELLAIDEQIKLLEQRKSDLKKEFFSQVDVYGSKDSRGNAFYQLGNKIIKKEARKSIKINVEKAKTILTPIGVWEKVALKKYIPSIEKLNEAQRLGLIDDKQYKAVCDELEEVDENLLEQLVMNEELSMDTLKEIVDEKVTNALVIKEIKE